MQVVKQVKRYKTFLFEPIELKLKPTKLSEAWELASEELTQIKGAMGTRSTRKVCAMGALGYYFGDDEKLIDWANSESPAWLDTEKFQKHLNSRYYELIDDRTIVAAIAQLNDYYGWTFKDFAREARSIGL